LSEETFFARVYKFVRRVPRGRVVTYGQVALLLGVPRGARAVGWALRGLNAKREKKVPWHRVVGSGGRISLREGQGGLVQRRLLRAEGVRFVAGHVDMLRYGMLLTTKAQRTQREQRGG
jgi:methylated-DNA-protein-cysteine methyltransferase related protein